CPGVPASHQGPAEHSRFFIYVLKARQVEVVQDADAIALYRLIDPELKAVPPLAVLLPHGCRMGENLVARAGGHETFDADKIRPSTGLPISLYPVPNAQSSGSRQGSIGV